MSRTTIALEAAVAAVIAELPANNGLSSARQRANVDKAFGSILKIIAPRIRHFIRQYGLVAHWEDAEQCCAIAVHRAIAEYDPAKAQFTTFVNWQIRGELQSLRFRVMTDQRPSARKVGATTVSLHAVISNSDGEEASLEANIEDDGALARTEAGASNYLALAATASLIKEYIDHERAAGIDQLYKRARPKRALRSEPVAPSNVMPRLSRPRGLCPDELAALEQKLARDKDIIERRVFEVSKLDESDIDAGVTKERVRQITKRASRTLAELAAVHPRFALMADCRKPNVPAARVRPAASVATTPILPPLGQPHNMLSRLVAIAASESNGSMRSDDFRQGEVGDALQAVVNRLDVNAPSSQTVH